MNCQIPTKEGRACRCYARIFPDGIRRCYFHRNASADQVKSQTVLKKSPMLSTTPVDERIKVVLRKSEFPVYDALSESEDDKRSLKKLPTSYTYQVVEDGVKKPSVVVDVMLKRQNDDIDLSYSDSESDYYEPCTSESEDEEEERSDITVSKQELLEVL